MFKRLLIFTIKVKTLKDIGNIYSISSGCVGSILTKHGIILNKRGKRKGSKAWNKSLKAETCLSIQKQKESYANNKHNHKRPPGICASNDGEILRREKIRSRILKRYEDGWMPKAGRCKKILINTKNAGVISVDGSWEEIFAHFLDSLNIKWQRNIQRFDYNNEYGVRSKYTPDFYIAEYDLYVEVKGYETAKDRCKWVDFPHKLRIIRKSDIKDIRNKRFILES